MLLLATFNNSSTSLWNSIDMFLSSSRVYNGVLPVSYLHWGCCCFSRVGCGVHTSVVSGNSVQWLVVCAGGALLVIIVSGWEWRYWVSIKIVRIPILWFFCHLVIKSLEQQNFIQVQYNTCRSVSYLLFWLFLLMLPFFLKNLNEYSFKDNSLFTLSLLTAHFSELFFLLTSRYLISHNIILFKLLTFKVFLSFLSSYQ